MEAIHEPVEVVDVQQPDGAARQADQRVPRELSRVVEAELCLCPKDGAEALDRPEDRVGDDRCDERWDQDLRLDVVAVEQLRAEDGPAQWRPEDRTDPCRHPDCDGDTGIAGVKVQQPTEVGPESCADLGRRPLAPARSPRADRDGRREQLDDRDTTPDPARMVVIGGDRRICAMAFRLRCEAEHENARDEPTESDHEGERPRPRCIDDRRATLAGGRGWRIAGQHPQEEAGRQFERGIEGDGPDPADDSDHRPEDHPLAEVGRRPDPSPQAPQEWLQPSGDRYDHAKRSSSAAIRRRPTARPSSSGSASAPTISSSTARRLARIAARMSCPRWVRCTRVARRSAVSGSRVVRPRRSRRRRSRLVAGSVTPTRAATSPTRAPSASLPTMRMARHWGNVSSYSVSAPANARVVKPTAPMAIRSRSSAMAALVGAGAAFARVVMSSAG